MINCAHAHADMLRKVVNFKLWLTRAQTNLLRMATPRITYNTLRPYQTPPWADSLKFQPSTYVQVSVSKAQVYCGYSVTLSHPQSWLLFINAILFRG